MKIKFLLFSSITASAQVEVAITAGQSNARSSVMDFYVYYGNQTAIIRRVDTYLGGAGIENWVTDDLQRAPYYLQKIYDPSSSQSEAEVALTQPHNKVTFLWMQGETDTETNSRVATYEIKLRTLFHFIDIDFAATPKFQKVIGLIWYSNPEITMGLERTRRIYRIRAIQTKVAKEVGANIVDTCGIPRFADTPPSTDYVHISYPAGAAQLGWQLRQAILNKQDYFPESIKMVGTDVSMKVIKGKRYQLLKSVDLNSWFVEANFRAETTELIQNTLPTTKLFFKLTEIEP